MRSATKTSKPVVAHLVKNYLNLTQSWVYQQVSGHCHFEPIVIARQLLNLDAFPFPEERLYHYQRKRIGANDNYYLAAASEGVYEALTRRRLRHFYTDSLTRSGACLMHAHVGTEGYLALPIRRATQLPLITTFYGADMSKLPQSRPWWRKRFSTLFREGDLFLCEGVHMARQLERLGCPSTKIRVHHLGVDVERIEFVSRTLENGQPIRLLIAASFREKKGIPYAIQAFATALAKGPNMELHIIGGVSGRRQDRSILERCQRLVMEAGIAKKVIFRGYLAYPDFLHELRSAHLVLAPSVTAADGDTEGGAPVVVIEASAAGLPVIATYHCDIPDVILHGRSGWLVEERDTDQLAAAILRAAESPQRWIEMGRTGRQHIEQEYNAVTQARQLEEHYTRLIGYEGKHS